MNYVEAAAALVNLEETSIPEWSCVMVGYLNADGQQAFKYSLQGEASFSPIVFALENIIHDMLHRE